MDLLSGEELNECLSFWREQFERAQAADFWFCLGPGRSLKGTPARRAQYRWADIPKSLLVPWAKEHRRRRRTVRALKAVSAIEPPAEPPPAA
jgi:hypothetical protein